MLFTCMQFTPFFSIADDLTCEPMPNGTFSGTFIRIINETAYPVTNYLFKDSDSNKEGCVQADETNEIRSKIIYGAFILEKKVTISVSGSGHYIDGISFSNN